MNAEPDINPSFDLTSEIQRHALEFDPIEKAIAEHHLCHRCTATIKIIDRFPYCTECNWDSLTDPSMMPLHA